MQRDLTDLPRCRARGVQEVPGRDRQGCPDRVGRLPGVVTTSRRNKTPAINEWLARHPRFHMHFTLPGRVGSTRSCGKEMAAVLLGKSIHSVWS